MTPGSGPEELEVWNCRWRRREKKIHQRWWGTTTHLPATHCSKDVKSLIGSGEFGVQENLEWNCIFSVLCLYFPSQSIFWFLSLIHLLVKSVVQGESTEGVQHLCLTLGSWLKCRFWFSRYQISAFPTSFRWTYSSVCRPHLEKPAYIGHNKGREECVLFARSESPRTCLQPALSVSVLSRMRTLFFL